MMIKAFTSIKCGKEHMAEKTSISAAGTSDAAVRVKRIATVCILALLGAVSFTLSAQEPEWRLDWIEEFDAPAIDSTVWSRIDRGTANWQDTQSKDDRCYELRDGVLVLKGIVNPDTAADPAPYLTGGLWTKDKKAFEPGRFEVRARLHGAKGAWPAIWLLPFDYVGNPWPYGGEIDIMERLNNNHIAYQTVHSHYTYDLGIKDNPRPGVTYAIDRDGWNVYGVDILPDRIVFHINGTPTLSYPKVNDGAQGQFPFYIPQYLLIDMQLGGSWVGDVDSNDLPVEMEIDWVKHYVK